MSSGQLLGRVLKGIAACLGDLGAALGDPALLEGLVSDLGGTLASGATAREVQALLGPLPADLDALATAAAGLDPSAPPAQLLTASAAVIAAIAKLANDAHALAASPTPAGPAPFDDPAFWTRFFDDALALLAYDALRAELPAAYALLRGLGVAVENPGAAGAAQRMLRWDRIPAVLSNPGSVLTDAYGWGGAFDPGALLDAVADACTALGLTVSVEDPAGLLPACWDPSELDADHTTVPLRASLYRAVIATGTTDPVLAGIDVGLELVPIPDLGSQGAPGLGPPVGAAVALDAEGSLGEAIGLAPGVTLQVTVDGDVAVRVELRPSGARLATPATVTGSVTTTVRIAAQPPQPWVLGDRGSTGLQVSNAIASASATMPATGSPEATLGVQVTAAACLDLSSADGFLQAVLGRGVLTTPINGGLTWSSVSGLHLMGGAGMRGNIPLNANLGGVIALSGASAQAVPAGPGTQFSLGVSGELDLGPLTASVDTVGLAITVTPIAHGAPPGNLGPLDLAFGFRPPNGLGLALDAGVATGGGYIQCDAALGQYAGVLELALESLSLTAIGLIQTKNADGSPLPGGFSLLVIISVEFLPPVELGFGFSLNGVGGLFGWGRTINADALRAGVRGGSLSDIMFPVDPVGHAPQLIQALSGFFPVAPGRLLIGPFVQIQWGSPVPILTAELGVMVELPAPIRVAVMGVLNLGLPQADAEAVVQLNLDAFGLIDFGAGELSLDASLYHSKIAEFAISGDMALRFGWKPAVREFVVSIGGFFPSFTPPPGFPALKRLSLSLSSGDNPTFTLQAYLAVTSNTVQFGALAQLAVTAGPASLAGMLSFDALIHLNPFGLQVNFAAALTVKVDGNELLGVTVAGQLSGPDPWLISGQASIKLLFISVSVSFTAQLGSGTPPPPPAPVQVIDLLGADLAKPACWSALPPAGEAVVTVTPPPADAPQLYAHPLGSLTFHQRTTPLGLTLQKYGAAAVAGPAKLGILSVAYGDAVLATAALVAVDDAFAPGQYLSLSDNDALSQPAFASYQAGVAFTPAAPDYDQVAAAEVTAVGYTVDLIDSHGEPPPVATVTLGAQATGRLITTGPTARAPVRTTGARRYQGTPGDIAVRSGAPGGPVVR